MSSKAGHAATPVSEDMKRAKGPANGLESCRKLLLAERPELLPSLRIKLDTLAAPGPAALEDLAPV